MKKIVLLAALCMAVWQPANAQTFGEWFRQKKTQKKYLLQQIAALQVYIGYAKQGYEIAGKGVNIIRNIKNGDLNLHRDFFSSFKQVNPAIARYAKVADIVAYQLKVIRSAKTTWIAINGSTEFTTAEAAHCKKVLDFLLADCLKSIEELAGLLQPDQYEMKDDERLKRIEKIYEEVQSKYAFSSSFGNDVKLLLTQRLDEKAQIYQSKILNGIQ